MEGAQEVKEEIVIIRKEEDKMKRVTNLGEKVYRTQRERTGKEGIGMEGLMEIQEIARLGNPRNDQETVKPRPQQSNLTVTKINGK